ncbi:unnamed protein product [Calypogeia fissa]
MPGATIYRVESKTGSRIYVGPISYKIDDTFSELRVTLGLLGVFDFPFQFLDVKSCSRVLERFELFNNIEDCGEKIIVIPKLQSGECYGSSNASNSIATMSSRPPTQDSHSEQFPTRVDVVEAKIEAYVIAPTLEIDPQVSFRSTCMCNDLKKAWASNVERLIEYMKATGNEDQSWKVKTWDKDGEACGKIECCECDQAIDGSSKGAMCRVPIANCFTNYRTKHLTSVNHVKNMARRRNKIVDAAKLKQSKLANRVLDRVVLEHHLQIVDRINEGQAIFPKLTFDVIGDVDKEPMDLQKFKLLCNFCCEHLTMIPKQQNMEPNLLQHCGSLSHMNALARSQRQSSGAPVLLGRAGRPRVRDKRDRAQRQISSWVTS